MQIVVVGAGISGLACAYRLHQLGHSVTVLERSQRAGGVIDTLHQSGFQLEMGPQSFLSSDRLLAVVRELGLEGELQQADRRAARYILLKGKLVRAPMAPPALLGTPLVSLGTKLRLLIEPFRRTIPPEDDESIAAFVRRKFGGDLLDNMVGPLVSGIYAGDPERLSLRAAFPFVYQWEKDYGSVLKGAMKSAPPKGKPRPTLCSFTGGVVELIEALRSRLGDHLRTGVQVEAIQKRVTNGNAAFELHLSEGERRSAVRADAVVLAAPTQAAAQIVGGVSPQAGDILRGIEYAAVGVVNTGYAREQVTHPLDGFGFLVPRHEGLNVLGTVWTSSLFPGRAPSGMVSLASFVGGATNPEIVTEAEDKLVEIVHAENARVLGIQGTPAMHAVRTYQRALPQYNLGHAARIARLRDELKNIPGLFVTGNYLEGPSIAACVDQAWKTADEAHRLAGATLQHSP